MTKNEETKPPVIKLTGMHRESIREPDELTSSIPDVDPRTGFPYGVEPEGLEGFNTQIGNLDENPATGHTPVSYTHLTLPTNREV